MAGDGTVEWGGERRAGLLDRLFGDAASVPAAQRLSAPSLAAGVVSAALFAAAELLPWMTVRLTVAPEPGALRIERDVPIEAVGTGFSAAYYLGVLLLLTLVGLAMGSRPHTRRAVTAAGCGLAAALVVLLAGAIGRGGTGGELSVYEDVPSSVGPGPFFAVVGAILAAAALITAGWHPAMLHRRHGRRDRVAEEKEFDDPDEEPGPIDLTVTPA